MEEKVKEMDERISKIEMALESMMPKEEEEVEAEAEVEEQKPLKSRTVKEEFSEEVQKEELTEAAVKPIKHNPESVNKKTNKVEFAKGKFNTTLDRVLNKLNK